jgi:phage tail protein X
VSAAPRAAAQTPKQHAASIGNLVKARAAQRRSGALHHHTAKQQAASRQNLVKARSAQRARRSGKTYKPAKNAKAPCGAAGLHSLPLCAAVAVAASLAWAGGPEAGHGQVWELYQRTGPGPVADVLEAVAEHGLAGWRLASFEPACPDLYFPGLVYGIQLSIGYHAVLSTRHGMLSWGMVLPLLGTPEEAWILGWEGPDAAAP